MNTKNMISVLLFMMMTFMGCPGEEDCNDLAYDVTVPNLAAITPLKALYEKDETITFSLIVPSENNYFGTTVDIFQQTQDRAPLFSFSSRQPFEGNTVNVIKGAKAKYVNQHYLHYNADNHSYELMIEITLNTVGEYSIFSYGDRIHFQGDSYCNRFLIETNVEGTNADYKIEFEVTE